MTKHENVLQKLANEPPAEQERRQLHRSVFRHSVPLGLFLALLCTLLFIGVLLPLRGLYFYAAFPASQFGNWLLFPTRLLFPHEAVIWPIHYIHTVPAPLSVAWKETSLLLFSLVVWCGLYLLAVSILPKAITLRAIVLSTTLFGISCLLFPTFTSQDLFSYIAYARIGVLYHLNPLTTLPTAIHTDAIYPFLFWIHQPSAYGPTWVLIICALQSLAVILGFKNILAMTLLLRGLGLVIHLGSTWLIWLLTARLQNLAGEPSLRRRLTVTLAFAWNPLLLFEACVNAHNDTTILFFILLAVWFLLPRPQGRFPLYLGATVCFALAACLKVTLVVLLPLLLLFIWRQQPRRVQSVVGSLVAYVIVVALLYAPFWQHGAILHLFQINPGTTRDINSPYEFLVHLFTSLRGRAYTIITPDIGAPAEQVTHKISMLLFCALYGIFFLRALFVPQWFNTLPSFIRWMAGIWLLYCLVGSPWFWPWYLTTFFGLFALTQATDDSYYPIYKVLRLPLAVQLLAFTALGLYCFSTWAPNVTLLPLLPHFQWTYTRGLWLCLVPLLALRPSSFSRLSTRISKTIETSAKER